MRACLTGTTNAALFSWSQPETGVRETGQREDGDAAALRDGESPLQFQVGPRQPLTPDSLSLLPQYYEMSYGLNIEMHKQVGAADSCFLPPPLFLYI